MAKLTNAQKASRKRARWLAEFKATLSDNEMNEDSLKAMGLGASDIAEILGTKIIDAEIISVEETPNVPAVIENQEWTAKGMEGGQNDPAFGPYTPRPGRTADNRSTIKENVAQHDSILAENSERRCVATNARGERCRRFAIHGSTVCKSHGGSTRHIVNKARIRVEMASNKLMGKLVEFAFDDNKPPAVQLDAIKDSLNRAGLKPRETVEFGIAKPFEEIYADIGTMTRAESRAARGLDPDTAEPLPYNESSPFDLAEYQGNSTPATALHEPNDVGLEQESGNQLGEFDSGIHSPKSDYTGPASIDSDADPIPRPSHKAGRDRPRERRSGPIVTGDAALDLAAQINRVVGALRELE